MPSNDRWNDKTVNIYGCRDIDIENFKRFNGGCHSHASSLGKHIPLEMFCRELQIKVLEGYKRLLAGGKFPEKEQEWKDNIKRVEAML